MYETTREPAPLDYTRIQLGDVGYVRRGCFNLLFSAGRPLGERKLGEDVPLTFEPLTVGPVINVQPRLPGYLSTNTVIETGVSLGASVCAIPYVRSAAPASPSNPDLCSRMLEPGFNISFQLTEKQGAALVTKYPTYREDIRREQVFEEYTKRHYDSWVEFIHGIGDGNDLTPVLVTGVDTTRDFAMMSYSNNGVCKSVEFTISAPGAASASVSAWGLWRTEGSVVHTNCGPQPRCPPSSSQTTNLISSGSSHTETTPDGYNQCVFVRYYTMRKRPLLAPRVIKAGAGPRYLDPGGRDGGRLPLEAQAYSDSSSNAPSSLPDDDESNDRSSIADTDSEPDEVTHNTNAVLSCHTFPLSPALTDHSQSEKDDFDAIADYVFRVSS